MGMTSLAVSTILLLGASSASFAQIVVPYPRDRGYVVARLDRALPVATVTPPGDAITLANPKPGEDFVRGTATLDTRDRDRPMIVFRISNGSDSALPPNNVVVHVLTVYARRDGSPTVNICGYMSPLSGLLDRPGSSGHGTATLAPGATVTMAIPTGPSNCVVGRPNVPLGFLVGLTSNGPIPDLHESVARLRRALEAQRLQAQH